MADHDLLLEAYVRLRRIVSSTDDSTLPSAAAIQAATAALPQPDDASYLAPRGSKGTVDHLLGTIVPALNGQNLSGRYFGFVTGSTLPIAEAADNIVSALDQNVQVHLPEQTVCTVVEDAALKMIVSLLDLGSPDVWSGRTFTTGATASNVLGLAQGREAVVSRRLGQGQDGDASVAELGVLAACRKASVSDIQVLTSSGHSSLYKAASIVGLGRNSVKELPLSADEPWRLDLNAVEQELARPGVASILAVSAGEVNTGRFATTCKDEMQKLRSLADSHGAWIHVDGAFGIFARMLPKTQEYADLGGCTDGLELADSITADGHKLLNVPYDAGIYLSRSSSTQAAVFQNANAAYLASQATSQIQSPLNMGIENSRRFRALPVYATLLSEGRQGITDMFARMVRFARKVADFVRTSEAYQLLPTEKEIERTSVVVLFRAKDGALNEVLVQKINETRKMYVSGTRWKGEKACRIAVSSWRVDLDRDLAIVEHVLTSIAS